MLSDAERAFLNSRRVAHLATADAGGAPHVVPVCFAVDGDNVYITIDAKPKTVAAAGLKRVRNIVENPQVALIADHYDDRDWSRLGWVMVRGPAELLADGAEHDAAQELLRQRYPQYAGMALAQHPVIAIRIARATSWGNLTALGGAIPG